MLSDIVDARVAVALPIGLNAPYGARCFLTPDQARQGLATLPVLMRLMVLGAF